MSDLISLGLWIKRRRKALDLTQAELAQRVGCSLDLIQKIEADARRPSRAMAARLADMLELAADEHAPFIQAARRELGVSRLAPPTESIALGAFVPAHAHAADPVEHSPPIRRTHLPAPPTALIGRTREMTQICALLHTPAARLVTLTGPGGTGKTHLGLQVATELLDDFPDGVFFVDLAPIRASMLVISAIAQTLGLREIGSQSLATQLQQFLGDKRMLLLLDNFEQVLDAAPLLADLLAAAARVKLLVTSRERLHLRGEKEVAVPPLALPPTDPSTSPSLRRDSSGQAGRRTMDYAAVQLFVERAIDARLDFQLTDANSAAVVEICTRLDGLPLAIELAAARIKLFTPEALLARLRSRLALLTDGPHDLPLRQQTIRNTIAWSYDLLTEAEQTLFRRLGIFVGGCTLEAAEAACGDNEARRHGDTETPQPSAISRSPDLPVSLSVLDGLAALVDKSLVRQVAEPNGEPRFVMLETLREYALERLEASGDAEQLRR